MPCDAGETRGECVIKSKKRTKTTRSGAAKAPAVAVRPTPQHQIVGDGLVVTGASVPAGAVPVLMYRRAIVAFGRVDAEGALHFALPVSVFGGRFEIVDAASGKSLGIGPITPPGPETVTWEGWDCVDGRISGQFRIHPADGAGWDYSDGEF